MRVLQAHNRHGSLGGADEVLDLERQLLEQAGHSVEQLFTAPAESGGVRDGLDAVWNQRAVKQVEEMVRAFRPDVLHVHTPFPLMSPAVFRAGRSAGVATVATAHSFRYTCIAGTLRRDGRICEDCGGRRVKWPAVVHRCYHDSLPASISLASSLTLHHAGGTFSAQVDRFLAMTEFAKDILVRDGVPAENVVVKPNCVPDPGAAPAVPDRPRHVLFVGRLVEEKGISTLLQGWARANAGGYTLRVCGDGPLRHLVEQAAAADPSVVFTGWLSHDQLAAESRAARLVVVPSEWYEAGPPLVLLDALAHGTAVLASDLSNISATVVAADAGRVFRTGDADSLASTLSSMLADPEALDAWGRRGRRLYDADHTPERVLETLLDTYGQTMEAAVR